MNLRQTIRLQFPTADEIELARALREWRCRILVRYGARAYADARQRHESLVGFRWRSQ